MQPVALVSATEMPGLANPCGRTSRAVRSRPNRARGFRCLIEQSCGTTKQGRAPARDVMPIGSSRFHTSC